MAITRTPMVDDDGSGTTGTILNNLWKQELYAQIDGMVTQGAWTPIDASAAALALTVGNARYWKFDKLVMVSAYLTYPLTADGSPAAIGGLPFFNGPANGGLYAAYAAMPNLYTLPPGSSSVFVLNGTTGANRTNAQLAGAALTIVGVYLTA